MEVLQVRKDLLGIALHQEVLQTLVHGESMTILNYYQVIYMQIMRYFLEPLTSSVATGTAPFSVTSTTMVTNLNAQMLGGKLASAFALAVHNHTFSGTFTGSQVTSSGPSGNGKCWIKCSYS